MKITVLFFGISSDLVGENQLEVTLEKAISVADFKDYGRGRVTNFANDNGKFAAPTLWNIELTAPYMHDGRFDKLKREN